MRLKKLDIYISTQVFWATLFGISLFTVLFISTSLVFQVLKLMINYKVSFSIAGKFFILSLPQVIAYTIPMGILLGVMNVFSQLSSNFEIIAFKTHGISLKRAALPVLVFALVLSVVNLLFYSFVVPHSLREARDILLRAKKRLAGAVVQGPNLTMEMKGGIVRKIVALSWDPSNMTMYNLTVTDWSKGIPLRIIFAERAKYDPSSGAWKLYNVINFELSGKGTTSEERIVPHTLTKLKEMSLSLVPPQKITRKRRLDEYDILELIREYRLIREAGGDSKEMLVEIHSKLAIPFAGFVFAGFAVPLSNQPVRTSSLMGAGVSLLIILFYYVIFYLGKSLSLGGTIPPAIGIWLPDILFGVIAIYLIYQGD